MNQLRPAFSLKTWKADAPFFVMAGPCVLETESEALLIARTIKEIGERLGLPMVFKASFDKANRTSGTAHRGPGMDEGLKIFQRIEAETGLPMVVDVHWPEQTAVAAKVCQVLQIPAFLCRQTDLVVAAAQSSCCVNVKKGQFLAPTDTEHIVKKIKSVSPEIEVVLTERGTSFGYGNLVVDMRSFPIMRQWADLVVYDATHSLQLPGAGGGKTTGQREYIPYLAQAAMATGCVDGLFLEVHPEPARSPSDAENIWPLDQLESLLRRLRDIRHAACA